MGTVWENLSGRNIILAGNDCRRKQLFQEHLAYRSSKLGGGFSLSGDLQLAGPEDLVFLFAGFGQKKGPEGPEANYGVPEQNMDCLMEDLLTLTQKKPVAVLISDNCVYGRQFGTPHLLREDEIGYISHTSEEDRPAICFRLAEHLAYRLASEGINIRIARAGDGKTKETEELMIEAAVKVLLQGEPGQVYNLPVGENLHFRPFLKTEESPGDTSPLSPMDIRTDSHKFQQRMSCTETANFGEIITDRE